MQMHPLARLSFLLLLLLADVALGQTNEPQFRKPVNCANLQNGNYVWGCSRYYSVCTNGRELPMQCYTSLKLNPDNNQCDSPASIAVCADTDDTNKLFRSKDPFTCDGQEDGNYEAGPCSNFYIQCSQGRRFDQTCPNGLVFNRQASVCDFASKCKKAGRRVPKKMTARIAYAQPLQPVLEDSFSDPVSPVAPQSPQQPYYSQQQPAANNVEQDSPAVQADAPFDCVGKSDGVYLTQGTACTDNFWKCANGQAFAYNCTKGLAYNVANDQCDYPHFVIACGGTPPDPTSTPAPAPPLNVPPFVCTGRADGLYTDRNCASNYFYSCQGGGSTAMQCTPGLVFDSLSNLCDFPRTCGKPKPPLQQQDPVRTNLEHGTSNYYFGGNKRYTNVAYPQYLPSSGSSPNQPQGVPGATAEQPQPPSSPPGFQCAGKKDGYYVRTPCTPQFFSCSNGVASPVTCPGELVFDAQQAQCEFPSACGQPASGPSSPAAPSNPALPPASSPNERFPPPPQVPSAAVPIPVPQPPQLVPPPPSTGFNCAGKRNGYYVRQPCTPEFFSCSNGISTNATCPGGLVFDVQRAQCEFQAACGQQQPTSPEQPGQIPPPAEVPTISAPSAGGQPPQIDCINRRDGYYYKQACRSQFVICASGTSIQQSCPAGTVFEPRTGQCQYPAQCGQAQQSSTGPGQSSSSPVPSPQQTAPAAGRPTTGGQDVVDVPAVPPVNQIAPGTAFSCAGRPNGYYIQQPCQQRFVSCSGGQMRRQSCPDGLVFDPNNAQCEFAAVCGKSDNTGQPPSTPPEQPSSPPSVAVQIPSSPTECEQRTKLVSEPNPEPAPAQSTVVPVPQPSTPQSPQAVPGQPGFSCVGKKDGHYMRQQCQPSYTVCSGGVAVRRRCPDGLVFDADTAQCEFRSQCGQQSGTSSQGIVPAAAAQQVPPSVNQPSTVQTPQQQLPVAPPAFPPPAQPAPEQPLPPSAAGFKCTGRIDGYYYRKACTSHFYTCVGGHATQLTCPGNLVFDPTKALCQYPQVCGRPSQPDENGVDTSVPQPQPPQVDFNCQGKRNGYYVKRGCTSQFYTCLGGMATKLSCPASLVFDPQSASCQYPNICKAGQPQQPASSSGNQEDTDDVPPANPAAAAPQPPTPQQQVQPPVPQPQPQPSNSNNFDCSNKANGAYAMGNCVNSYTLCSNSVAHLLQCPGELVFSPASNNTCDYRSACQSGPPQQPPAEQPLPATTPNNAGGPVPSSSSSSQRIPAPQQPSPVASQQQIPNVQAPEQPQPASGSQRGNQQTTQQQGVQGQALPPRQRNKPSPVVQPQRSAVCGQSAEGLHTSGCNEKFYACTAGSSTQMDCPTGLFFDADTQRCDLKEVIVACGGQKKNETQQSEEGPARKPGTRQPTIPGSSSNPKLPVVPVAPEFDCSNKAIGYYSVGCTSRYHSCTGINSYSFDCPSGLKYDQEAAQCDYEANVPACGGSRPTTPRPVTPPAQSGNSQAQGPQTVAGTGDQPSPKAAPIQSGMHPQQPASNPCGELPDGAYGPACSAYYFICSNGMPFDYVCGGGLIYDMTTKQCLPAQQMPSCPQQ